MYSRIILLCIGMFFIPFFIGMFVNKITRNKTTKTLSNWVNGFVLCLGFFELLVLPCIFLDTSLVFLSKIYILILVILSIIGIKVCYDDRKDMKKAVVDNIKKIPWQTIFVMAIILFQVFIYVNYVHTDHDDSFYVATSVVAVDTDTVFQYDPYTGERYTEFPIRYVLSPFPIFTAVLSDLSGIHATILAHTILPGIYLLFTYATYALIGYELFRGRRKDTAVFVFFIAFISMLLPTSIYTQSSFMLMRIWQGKAFLTAMLLPFVFLQGCRMILNKKYSEWIVLLFAMLACCLVSSMGIMLGVIMLGIMMILVTLLKKEYKYLLKAIMCCSPNVILAIIYLMAKG